MTHLRPAQKIDAPTIAHSMVLAGGGVIEFFLHDLVPNMPAEKLLAETVAQEEGEHSYKNALIVENLDEVVGVALRFPLSELEPPPEGGFIPKERIAHILPLLTPPALPNSLYLQSIAVLPSHRGEGLGKLLYNAVEEKAREGGFSSLSLHVWEKNTSTLNWYERLGFERMERKEISPDPLLTYGGGVLFMKKELV